MFNSGYSDIGGYPLLTKLQRPAAISYDTSSKDPHMLRSRIFVGGLNTNSISRDNVIQLFSSYGTIMGVTLFKGYAFVQYSSVHEADLAVSALNSYYWHGSALEVKLAAKDKKGATLTSSIPTGESGVKLQRPSAISYDTSSKEPHMLRSRIFVGGLNTNSVSRDDVIQLFASYGAILGVTLFKGYAFVQYSSVPEADLAVSALNSYYWHGSALEVKTVADSSLSGAANGAFGKRPAQNDSSNGAKKGRPQDSILVDATVESRNEFDDFFLCGVCKFTASDLDIFITHRKMKSAEEPKEYLCQFCAVKYETCFELSEHLGVSHNLSVYAKSAAAPAADDGGVMADASGDGETIADETPAAKNNNNDDDEKTIAANENDNAVKVEREEEEAE